MELLAGVFFAVWGALIAVKNWVDSTPPVNIAFILGLAAYFKLRAMANDLAAGNELLRSILAELRARRME